MRRLVLFDADAHVAAQAARLLADECDVAAFGTRPHDGAVILVGSESRIAVPAEARAIGVLTTADEPAAATDWYGLVPAGAGRAVVARAVRNAFADLDRVAEVARLERELADLNVIGIRLSLERDPDRLLDTILHTAREITASDAGSLYLVESTPDGGRRLRFMITQNDSRVVTFQATTLALDHDSIAGHVALTAEPVNIADAYAIPPGSNYQVNRSYDQAIDYRTRSVLAVPMKTPPGEVIGVVQLINAKPSPTVVLGRPAEIDRVVLPFGARYVYMVSSLASQAAVALQNSRHYEEIRTLFDGFVSASVTAIESRDPTTAGHSFRVADLTVGLAEAVNRGGRGRLAGTQLNPDALRELRYAALLHDFGKVAVRESVLGKAKKLHPGMLARIQHRLDLARRELELRCANRKLQYLVDKGARHFPEQAALLDAELHAALAELEDSLTKVVQMNEPAVLPARLHGEVEALLRRTFEDRSGSRHPVVTPDEADILAIARGSLTGAEYEEVRAHVVHTFQFLAQIPWPHDLRRLPAIARDHHEKLDGSGYPRGLTGDAIPLQARMMTIADIYDALTAFDRPYKPAIPPESAIDVLQHERRAGRIDGDLLDLFVDAKIFEVTREKVRGRPDAPRPPALGEYYY